MVDSLLRDVVFGDWRMFDGEHPLLAMLRSSGHPSVRDQLRTQLCEGYLGDLAGRIEEASGIEREEAALRAEPVGALLLGMGATRSVVDSPVLGGASFEPARRLVAEVVRVLVAEQVAEQVTEQVAEKK